MIGKIWFKLFCMCLLVVIPLMTAQYSMQKEAVVLISNLAEKSNQSGFLDRHMENLKKLSKLDPENSDSYRGEFERAAESKSVVADMALVKKNLIDDVLAQTLRNAILVLLLALAVTYGIARGIVRLFRRLLTENQQHALRLERMSALESWQKVARMMVHEMRAPITPIKLVATDIESKHQSLDETAFRQYLAKGAELIRQQVASIERLTENLTKFAKLPDVQKQTGSIPDFLERFSQNYRTFAAGLSMQVTAPPSVAPVSFDSALLNQLFFNLLKNAVEANPGGKVAVHIDCRQSGERTWITFTNSGRPIPPGLSDDIFKMHVSTKSGSNSANFGLGLTIAKKIALDHNGDLGLVRNQTDAVAFELELPNA